MLVEDCASYVIKESTGTIWHFLNNKSGDIIYKKLEADGWSGENILTKNTSQSFSVCLLKDDIINVYFQDLQGDIKCISISEDNFSEKLLLKRKAGNNNEIYFKVLIINDNVHIFYSIPDDNNAYSALVHQISYVGTQLQEPKVIDIIKYDKICPFRAYLNGDTILLFYTKEDNDIKLGYKIYDINSRKWKDFEPFDSIPSLKDITFLNSNSYTYIAYVYPDGNSDILKFITIKNNKHAPIILSSNIPIHSCTLFMIDEHIWVTCLASSKVTSWFSIDQGSSFNIVPNDTVTYYDNPVKSKYFSNYSDEKSHIVLEDIYLTKNDTFDVPVIENLYPQLTNSSFTNIAVSKPEVEITSYIQQMKTRIGMAEKRTYEYENILAEKDQTINKLNSAVEIYKDKSINLEQNFNTLNLRYKSLLSENSSLKQTIDSLQNELIKREATINDLNNNNIDIENTCLRLHSELDSIKNEVETFKDSIAKLNEESSKRTLFKRFFGGTT